MSRGKKRRQRPPSPEKEASGPAPAPEDGSERQIALVRREGWKIRVLRPKGPGGGLVELVVILGLALVLALAVQAWIVKPYQIPSRSMEPTLEVGQRIAVNRMGYHFGDPSPGDIVVFHPPAGADTEKCGVQAKVSEPCPMPTADQSSQYFIKRIVAGPGDTLAIKDGHPVVNGVEKADEPYIRSCGVAIRCNMPSTIAIPPDHYFMMGDNRGESDDSRIWGPVPRDWLIGKAFATYWPPSRWGLF